MTELVGPWVWDQIFAQRAGDPTQSPFGLIWHDQGMTSPLTQAIPANICPKCLGPIRDPGYDPVRVGWVRLEKSQIEVTGFGRLVTNHVVR